MNKKKILLLINDIIKESENYGKSLRLNPSKENVKQMINLINKK